SLPHVICAAAPRGSAQGSKRGPDLICEDRRLFPRREVAALVELVVVNEFGVGPVCPTSRGRIDFVGEGTHGDGNRDTPDVKEASARRNLGGVPIKARRGD